MWHGSVSVAFLTRKAASCHSFLSISHFKEEEREKENRVEKRERREIEIIAEGEQKFHEHWISFHVT